MALARGVATQLGIPFHTIDAVSNFRENVVQYFIDSYKDGKTPNPCVACNSHVRWNTLFAAAEDLGATHVASGHYARLQEDDNGRVLLLRGVDANKDQSYVLYGLPQRHLSRILFPLGNYTKPEIRAIAHRYSFPVADRPDSQDLCFVGNAGYRDFLVRHAPEVVDPGSIINIHGEKLGQHHGLAFYTIGQRKGLMISAAQPYYVLGKDTRQNTLIIGTLDDLSRDECFANQVNWTSGKAPTSGFRAQIKIRYKARDVDGWVYPEKGCRVHINFDEYMRDITPGQAVVFYDHDICLGGGILE